MGRGGVRGDVLILETLGDGRRDGVAAGRGVGRRKSSSSALIEGMGVAFADLPLSKLDPPLRREGSPAERRDELPPSGILGGGWLVNEKPNINFPYTGRLLLDIVRSLVMISGGEWYVNYSRGVLRVYIPAPFEACEIASAAGILITPRKPGE